MATNKHVETVEDLSDALDSLEEALAPVLNAPLSETLPKLDVLDKAKLQALLAYVTQDLVFRPSNAPAPATNGETIEGEGLPAHLRKTQKQIEREQRELEGSSSEDSDASDEEIKVIEEAAPPPPASVVTLPGGAARRQRQRIDPFAGYE
ncbi:hypothetical protein FRB99_008109 [Tulasnella sp. 403]|nr:hypothetical protein FRB99_008109 [Tulasnella sp. 403]